jgi:hypothetical protein
LRVGSLAAINRSQNLDSRASFKAMQVFAMKSRFGLTGCGFFEIRAHRTHRVNQLKGKPSKRRVVQRDGPSETYDVDCELK